MTKEEAITLLLEQTWVKSDYGFHLKKVKQNSHLYLNLKEAFEILKMGYDGDFGDIQGKDRDNLANLNVANNQWRRAGIATDKLKVELPVTASIADQIAAIKKVK